MKIISNLRSSKVCIALNRILAKSSLFRFESLDDCKGELLSFLEPGVIQSEFLIKEAAKYRKDEIRRFCLYYPSVPFGFIIIYALHAAINTSETKYVFGFLTYIISLVIAFRISLYGTYLRRTKLLMLAVADLLRIRLDGNAVEENEKKVVIEATLLNEPTLFHDSLPTLQIMPIFQESQENEAELGVSESLAVATIPACWMKLEPLFEEVGHKLNRGKVSIILLDQLIRRECKEPSGYDGPTINTLQTPEILGCKTKSIAGKFYDYNTRSAIAFEKGNSKTTHRKYLKILQSFYQKSGHLALYNQAIDLELFISSIKIERKTRKIHLSP